MKNKLIFIVIILGAIALPHTSYSAQAAQPGYWQRLKNYVAQSSVGQWWADFGKSDVVGRKRLQSVAGGGWTGLKRGALIGGVSGIVHGLYRTNASQEDYMDALITAGLGALAYNVINEALNAYNRGSLSEIDTVAQIKEIIKNRFLEDSRYSAEDKLELLGATKYGDLDLAAKEKPESLNARDYFNK